MNSSLKKSLYLGLAALGFVTVAGTVNANNASAKTYAKATSNKWIGAGTDNNVTFSGKNALYTKAGTLKGAKLVASTTTLKKLDKSKNSEDNFVAYRVATTNKGAVYYKVVSLDKQYRGWIYGGKSTKSFAGGLNSYDTFKNTDISGSDADKAFNFKKTGTTNNGSMLTYKAPMYTAYGAGRVIKDSSAYANDTLVITKQGTRTREGDKWVYVTDESNSNVNGWILRSGLNAVSAVPASKGVTVNIIDKATNTKIGSQVIKFVKDGGTDAAPTMNVENSAKLISVPKGYKADSNPWAGNTAAATPGSSVNYYVNKNSEVINTNAEVYLKNSNTSVSLLEDWNKITSPTDFATSVSKALTSLKGVEGTSISGSDIYTAFNNAGLGTIKVGTNTYKLSTTQDSSTHSKGTPVELAYEIVK